MNSNRLLGSNVVMLFSVLLLSAAIALLASNQLGFYAVLLVPVLVVAVYAIVSIRVSVYVITFVLFSEILWGMELAGGFLLINLIFIAAWLFQKFSQSEPDIYLDITLVPILIFLFFLVVSILDAPRPKLSYGMLLEYGKLLLFYIAFTDAIKNEKLFVQLVTIAIAAVTFSAIYGIYNLLSGNIETNLITNVFRLRGLSANPNNFANNVLICISFASYFFFYEQKKLNKTLLVLLIMFLVGSLMASLSRGASIGLAVLILFIVWDFRERKWPVVALGVLVIAAILFTPEFYVERLASLTKPSADPSLRWRARVWQGALQVITQYPVNGLGLGNFVAVSNNFVGRHIVAHNTYLEIFAESGIFALASFVLIWFVSFKNVKHAGEIYLASNERNMIAISKSLQATVIALMVVSLFDSGQSYFIVWLQFSFTSIVFRLSKSRLIDRQAHRSRLVV